ncbi:MAG TPA: tripartite tricarboxylate transporter substrate binding protein [Burkholderiales bacterium]|nr:tripartite tricarboxylate transporter substrate binding protein [Burkholderiales bacterium]
MKPNRRTVLAASAAAILMPRNVLAQSYPSRVIRIIVPFAAGGGSDIVARLLGDHLGKRLQHTVIIENKPGAGAVIGADSVAKSAPDGYTLLFATPGPQILNPYLMKSLPYDPKDFAGVAMLLKSVNLMVVNPNLPAKTVRELVDHAKANPGKLNFASSGIGTSSHLAGELFKSMANIDITHVPYRGNALALQDLLAGNVEIAIDAISALLPHAKSGALRALGVAAPERSAILPDVPTIAETLPGYDASSINYISVRAGTPAPIIERLNVEINAIMTDPAVRDRIVELGLIPITESPAALEQRISNESEKWKKVIEQMPAK